MMFIQEKGNRVIFHIHVIPKAGRGEIVGIQNDALKVKITAPPVEGKANLECIRFLSDVLGVKKAQITIESGHKSKRKTIAVEGLSKEDVLTILSGSLTAQ